MANSGTLIFATAGVKSSIEKLRPFIKGVMGRDEIAFEDEPHSNAAKFKLIGNAFALNAITQLAESLTLTEKSGISLSMVKKFANLMYGGIYSVYSGRMLSGEYWTRDKPHASADIEMKDIKHLLELAHKENMELRNAQTGFMYLQRVMKEAPGGELDVSAIYGAVPVSQVRKRILLLPECEKGYEDGFVLAFPKASTANNTSGSQPNSTPKTSLAAMTTPITTSSAQLMDADLSAQRDAETKPEIAEKTALMEVYTATDEATGTGVSGTQTAYLPLGKSSPPRILRIGTPALLLVVPLIYIVLLVIVASLHNKKKSSFGENTLEALQLAATIWHISFAAVIGPFLKTLALFSAERGTTLGSLEFLLTGQTTVSTLKNLFTLRIIRIWTLSITALWCLSPLGGQAVVRSLGSRTNTRSMNIPAVHYFSQTPLLATSEYSSTGPIGDMNAFNGGSVTISAIGAFRRTVLAAFSASEILLSHANISSPQFEIVVKKLGGTPQAVRLSQQDQWRNVRIPFMEYLPNYDDDNPTAWIPVPSNQIIPYSSFIGVPIRGGSFSREGNSSMVLQSRYQILKCGEEFDGRSWLSPQDSEEEPKVFWHKMNSTSYRLLPTQQSMLHSYVNLGTYPNMWLDLVNNNLIRLHMDPFRNRLKPESYLQMVVGGTCPTGWGQGALMLRVCNVSTSNVDATVNCTRSGDFGDLECRTTQMRRTKESRFSSNLTDLSDASLAQGILFEMPFTTASYKTMTPSTLESFIYNPLTTYSGVDDPVWPYFAGCFTNLSRAHFERADGTTVSGRNDLWHNTTATWTEFTENQYTINVIWFCVSAISTLILLACTIANIIIRQIIVAPDFLESIDGLTRHSPYIKVTGDTPYVGSGVSAGDRLLVTKKVKVQIQDVQPDMDLGKIALTTEVRNAKLDQTRIYC
ncbi:hypothetical protein FACUT_7349 [Fusarium acutatum]|uniref:Uncharacterized protein n=1 Tax=Fusarium acutatum TaxID=78861 RepID=A0A8H4JN09_9HYPO|nr:hypothetical protein FACUT_7349 [Fusarium acutatum]